jgi:hypothetical protein
LTPVIFALPLDASVGGPLPPRDPQFEEGGMNNGTFNQAGI